MTATRVILEQTELAGAYGSGVLVARIPAWDMPEFANDDGVVEVELRRDDNGSYEGVSLTVARLEARLVERGGFRIVTASELEDEIRAEVAEINAARAHGAE